MATKTPLSGTVTPFEGFSTEQYFETQPPPSDLEARVRPAREFVERWRKVQGKKVVVVTVSAHEYEAGMMPLADPVLTSRVEEQRYH